MDDSERVEHCKRLNALYKELEQNWRDSTRPKKRSLADAKLADEMRDVLEENNHDRQST